MESLKHQ